MASKKATEVKLRNLFDSIKAAGEPTGPTDFMNKAGLDRTYLYRFPVLAQEVADYGRRTQPEKSRRGAGATKTEARKRELDGEARREYALLAERVPELERDLDNAKSVVAARDERIATLNVENELLKRACEMLFLVASQSGANPHELEGIREKLLSAPNVTDITTRRRTRSVGT